MRWSFRARLYLIVGIASGALLVLAGTATITGISVQRHMDVIHDHFVPKLELGPRLTADMQTLTRAFQDAVASRDKDAFDEITLLQATFARHIAASEPTLSAAERAAMGRALDAYVDVATSVSQRLIAGETGEDVVEAIADMQARQRQLNDLVNTLTAFNREDLSAQFAAVARRLATARRARITVTMLSLLCLVGLSLWVIRRVMASVTSLREGLARFGSGDFTHPVPSDSDDELGDVARSANLMADNLRRLLEDRDAASAALADKNAKLDHALEELESFNYSVSHDLRAPLRPLDGFSQALLEDYGHLLDTQGKDWLRRIRAAAQRMSQLIEDMLQLSRMGRAEMTLRRIDLVPVARHIIHDLKQDNPARDVCFVSSDHIWVHGDGRLMTIVLENLLRNAWKFSSNQETATIELTGEEGQNDTVCMVGDNGAGFDATYANKLFQPFQRLHSSKEFEGTGIGLAIVQRIVRRHGGRVWAESCAGQGAKFYFSIPRAREDDGPVSAAS